MCNNSETDVNRKYPDAYFEHYIAMFQSTLDEKGYLEHADLYIHFEGIEEFKNLVKEIELIDKNNDWRFFAELAKEYGKERIDLSCIKNMAKIAQEVEATNEILSDKKILDSIQKGLAQLQNGEFVELDDVIEEG